MCVCGGGVLSFFFFKEILIFNNVPYFIFKGWTLSAWSLFSSLQQAPISEYVGISDSRTSKNATSGARSVRNYNFKKMFYHQTITMNSEACFVPPATPSLNNLFLPFNLQELCLHTKLLAPINCPIVDFLMKAPDPPPALIVRNAVQMLKVSKGIHLDGNCI